VVRIGLATESAKTVLARMRERRCCHIAILATLPFILKRPWFGILVWTWLGFMNPHQLAWGFAQTQPFAMIVALTTLVAILASREPKKFSSEPASS